VFFLWVLQGFHRNRCHALIKIVSAFFPPAFANGAQPPPPTPLLFLAFFLLVPVAVRTKSNTYDVFRTGAGMKRFEFHDFPLRDILKSAHSLTLTCFLVEYRSLFPPREDGILQSYPLQVPPPSPLHPTRTLLPQLFQNALVRFSRFRSPP